MLVAMLFTGPLAGCRCAAADPQLRSRYGSVPAHRPLRTDIAGLRNPLEVPKYSLEGSTTGAGGSPTRIHANRRAGVLVATLIRPQQDAAVPHRLTMTASDILQACHRSAIGVIRSLRHFESRRDHRDAMAHRERASRRRRRCGLQRSRDELSLSVGERRRVDFDMRGHQACTCTYPPRALRAAYPAFHATTGVPAPHDPRSTRHSVSATITVGRVGTPTATAALNLTIHCCSSEVEQLVHALGRCPRSIPATRLHESNTRTAVLPESSTTRSRTMLIAPQGVAP